MSSKAEHRTSYCKTVALAAVVTAASAAAAAVVALNTSGWTKLALVVPAAAVLVMSMTVVLGGLLCLYRDRRETVDRPDLFWTCIERVRHPHRSRVGRALMRVRAVTGGGLGAGDLVRIRDFREIAPTLDERGALDGLPFMPEMLPYCNQVFRVDRRIDKINDMINKTGPRRVSNAVTLKNVRCSGEAHGGCQAECPILWKESWLAAVAANEQGEVPPASALQDGGKGGSPPDADLAPLRTGLSGTREQGERTGVHRYSCQTTELWAASRQMSPWGIGQDLRPMYFGNIGITALLVATLTRAFNAAQGFRGGVRYPHFPQSSSHGRTPNEDLDLRPGEPVTIKNKHEIAKTLVDSRNRGLWFDREMIRFCGCSSQVRSRVSRIIDERTGEMLEMKTPCIVLEEITATGEFLRFCPQNEYIYWREIWLERKTEDGSGGTESGQRQSRGDPT